MKPNGLQAYIFGTIIPREASIPGEVAPHGVRPPAHGSPLLLIAWHAVQLPEDVQPEALAANSVPRTGHCLHDCLYCQQRPHCYCLMQDRNSTELPLADTSQSKEKQQEAI